MSQDEWFALLGSLRATGGEIASWEPDSPNLEALRCAQSRHRTLAHLRACQEQWLTVGKQYIARENPSVRIVHPWVQFEAENYADLPWEVHMRSFLHDRAEWLEWSILDWNRGGKMNGKPQTLATLTRRLATHEAYHVALVRP
jgi:hypothetical protein